MAIASASMASSERGNSRVASSDWTIFSIWPLVAAPYPVTDSFTWFGVYSCTSAPVSTAHRSATPRAWPTAMAVRTFLLKNNSSKAAACGCNSAISARSCAARIASRFGSEGLAGVFSGPQGTIGRRPFRRRAAPEPVSASPGSTPRTRRPSLMVTLDTFADAFHDVRGNIHIGVDRLHVVVFLQGVQQLEDGRSRRLVQRDELRGVHRDFG